MPLTEVIKPGDSTRKRNTESINSLSRNRSGRVREPSVENGSRGDDIAQCMLANNKKSLAKKTLSDNNSEKRVKTPIADKVPKKSVQRAKGSLALNKTIDTDDRKKRLFDVEESTINSTTTIKGSPTEGIKSKIDRSKPVRQPVRPLANEKRLASAKKKNWATVAKNKSGAVVKGDEEEEDHQQQQQQQQQELQPEEIAPRETKSVEIQPEGAPFSSCSFFEKLQQGVKAYFSSRNSLTEEKANKKKVTDGGVRTGAGVAKGGKEETKARTQENKINNKIKNLDSDLFYDRPRLKSNSGGQTNIFLNKKPKVLHYVRRKKLYHPKKHYERIQIPRKGYFYRLFEFRPSQSATCPVYDRMEPISLPTKPEIQIARLASSSPKVSYIHKKRMKKSRKRTSDITQATDEFTSLSSYLEAINLILNQQMVGENFEKEVNRIALNRPIEASLKEEGVGFQMDEKKSISSESLIFTEDRNLLAPAENSFITNYNFINVQKFDQGLEIESKESYPNLESERINPASDCILTETSDQSFDYLIKCYKESLGSSHRCGDLEISPIMMTDGESATNVTHETQPQIESNKIFPSAKEDDNSFATVNSKYKENQSLKAKPKKQFLDLLLGDIDLHLELQNYLQETKIKKANDAENISTVISESHHFFKPDAQRRSEENFDSALRTNADPVRVASSPLLEIESPAEENIRIETRENLSPSTRTAASETQLEINSKQPPQEDHVTNNDDKENLVFRLPNLLVKNEQSGGALDLYEKVSPMKTASRAKKSKSKLLRSNSIHSLSEEEFEFSIRTTNSEPNTFQRKEDTEADKKVKKEDDADLNQFKSGKKWCPTFEELSDIYSCILKLNSKRKNFQMSENLRSSSIISILKDKLLNKRCNADLVNFIKTLKVYYKPPSYWKSGADANKYKKLQEYVNTFQEILMSSLSVEQITYLNNVISQVQVQEASSVSCININEKGSEKSIPKERIKFAKEASEPEVAFSLGKTKEQDPKQVKISQVIPDPPKDTNRVRNKSSSKEKFDSKKIQPSQILQKVELSPPAELEKVLKSTFNSENVTKKTKGFGKILVNVKVCGSRVLVKDFSYIQDENLLRARRPVRDKVSELIIEKLTSDQSCEASLSDLGPAPPAPKKVSNKLPKKPRNIKIVLKTTKSGSQKPVKKLKIGKDDPYKKSQNLEVEDVTKIKTLKRTEERKNLCPVVVAFPNASEPLDERNSAFEYDQEKLKTQHPIDAIIETSESKIMESVESTENIYPNEKLTAETESSKKLEAAAALKEAPNKTMTERPLLKDLINDLGWSHEDNRKDLIRTRSYNININPDENFIQRESSTNEVKFLDDSRLKRGTVGKIVKKNRKTFVRQNTYFCYPSVVRPDKSVDAKKKISAEANLGVVKKKSPKATKKNDSRGVKATNLKLTKEADSKANKTNSKGMKKLDPRAMKTTNPKVSKQTDLKTIRTVNSKPVQKKNFRESLKRFDKGSMLPKQVAASEGLGKRSDKFVKSDGTPSKQKENIAQSGNPCPNVPEKNLENSILYMKGTSDFGSEESSINASTASSFFEEVLQQKQKPHSGNSTNSTSSSETAEIIEKYKTSPIVIFSTLDDSDGVTSQFAMIHSDSLLKTLSRSPISPTKFESVFKSHSDLKFYPGRISDSTEEQKPWVKFILTPRQEANADLPAHQIKVVDRHRQVQAETMGRIDESENAQIPLESIEKFIDELRQIRLRQKALEKRKSEKKKLTSSAIIKQKITRSHSDLTKSVKIGKQNCQTNKSRSSFLRTSPKGGEKEPGKEATLAKVVVSILQFLLEQRVKQKENVERSEKYSKSEKLPSDPDESAGDEKAVEKWRALERTASDTLNAVVNGVTKFEKLLKKKKLILALKEELKKVEAGLKENVESFLRLSKKNLEKTEKETPKGETGTETEEKHEESRFPESREELNLAECASSKESKAKELARKPSTYFDAEEEAEGENEECSNQLQSQSGMSFADTMLAILGERTTEISSSEEAYPTLSLTQSDKSFFSRKSIDSETEGIIFSKIHESLEENNVSYSMALFDSLLKKKGVLHEDEKLQNLLRMVEQKTKDLMRDLEKSAWTKLLFLIEEVSRIYDVQKEKSDSECTYRFITNQLNKPLAFIGKIHSINEKMTNLQNFLSQSKMCISEFHLHKVISGFVTKLLQIKNSVIPKLTSSVMRIFEDEVSGTGHGDTNRAVKSAPSFSSTSGVSEKKSQLQFLKSQIRDQRLFIEYLINVDSGSSSSEIVDLKNRVSEKLKELEKSLSCTTKGEDLKISPEESLLESLANSVSLSQITSF